MIGMFSWLPPASTRPPPPPPGCRHPTLDCRTAHAAAAPLPDDMLCRLELPRLLASRVALPPRSMPEKGAAPLTG